MADESGRPTSIELEAGETAILFKTDGTSSLLLPKDYMDRDKNSESTPAEINAIRCAAMLSNERLVRLVDSYIFLESMIGKEEDDKGLH